jgi:hypothetical protein
MAYDLLGNLLAEFGRFDEAHDCFARAIAIAPLMAGNVAGSVISVEQACKDPSLVEWVRSMAPRVRRVARFVAARSSWRPRVS